MLSFIETKNVVSKELYEVEMILKGIGKDLIQSLAKDIFNYFFKVPGKYLRPMLIILSAKIVKPDMTIDQREQLINLSVAIELIHVHNTSSAILDDPTIQALQFILIGIGTIGSIYTMYRISKNNYKSKNISTTIVYSILLILLAIVNIMLFSLPMAMRM